MTSCKIALVNPPFVGAFDGIPMGLLYLASALREHGHEPYFLDFGGTEIAASKAADEILAGAPDLIAITSTSPSFKEAIELASVLRQRNGDVVIAKGGWHERNGGFVDLKYMRGRPFNCAVTNPLGGEAEIVAIASAVSNGEELPATEHIISLLDIIPKYGPALPRYQTHDLVPARDLLPAATDARYSYHGIFGDLPATQLMTVRGCPFSCTFCAIPPEMQRHDLDAVERDLDMIHRHGYGAVFLDDGTFTVNVDRARKICELLRKRDLRWACQTRIDQVSSDLLRFMQRCGCTYIYFGLETGARPVAEAIHKVLDPSTVIDVVRETVRLGMKAVTSFIFGVPLPNSQGNWPKRYHGHDGPREWRQSVELIREAGPDQVVPSVFAYYPGSPAWKKLQSEFQDLYSTGGDREDVWRWFDDGYGAIHHVSPQVAGEIKEFLERSIPDLIWSSEDRKTAPPLDAASDGPKYFGPPTMYV